MANKTLYVSDSDETVWRDATKAAGKGGVGVSKFVSEALGHYLAAGREEPDDERDLKVVLNRADSATLVDLYRKSIEKFGLEKAALCWGRACFKEGRRDAKARLGVTKLPKAAKPRRAPKSAFHTMPKAE